LTITSAIRRTRSCVFTRFSSRSARKTYSIR